MEMCFGAREVLLSLGLVVFCCLSLNPASATPVTGSTCEQDYFFDHGTDKCEHCRIICYEAEHRGTVEECQRQCPVYVLRQSNAGEKIKDQDLDVTPAPHLSNPENDKSGISTGVQAGIAVSVLALFLVLLLAVFLRRRAHQKRLQARPKPTRVSTCSRTGVEETEVPLQKTTTTTTLNPMSRRIYSLFFGQPLQETEAGRRGRHVMALIDSKLGLDDDEVEPKTLAHNWTPIYRPSGMKMNTSFV